MIALLFVVYQFAEYLVVGAQGEVAGCFLCSFALGVRFSWPLRQLGWFWLTLAILAAAHVVILLGFTWISAADWQGPTFTTLMMVDFAVVLATIYLVYRLLYGVPPEIVGDASRRYSDPDDYPLG
jgi:hypothetical protein